MSVAISLPVLWHLGTLHGYEKLLVLLVAFGPFVVLTFAVRFAQRRALKEDEEKESSDSSDPSDTGDVSGRPPAT